MSHERTLLAILATTTLALPGLAPAAIDAKGMAYVSAAEGLSGRIQMRWSDSDHEVFDLAPDHFAEDPPEEDGTLKLETLRLYLDGNLDIGGGMKSTYHAEIRNDGSAGIKLHAYDIGLTGAFGQLSFGRLNGVADTMVPGGSLDAVAGSSAASPTSYPDDSSVRYVSPPLGGFKLGLSAKIDGSNTRTGQYDMGRYDGAFDNLNVAVSYSHPIGIEAGIGYEKVKDATGLRTFERQLPPDTFYDAKGYRLGLRYGLAGWKAAYEYRRYEAFNPFDFDAHEAGPGSQFTGLNFSTPASSYHVHRIAAQYKLDRLTASVNFSKETAVPEVTISDIGEPYDPITPVEPSRTVLGADVSYNLGAKSRIAVGLTKTKADVGFTDLDGAFPDIFLLRSIETDTLILDYQVNF